MNLLKPVYYALDLIVNQGAYANMALKMLPQDATPAEKGFATALTYSTLEHLLYIDHIINSFVHGRKPDKPAMLILRMGICNLLFLNNRQNINAIIVNDYVIFAKSIGKEGIAGFINAILRTVVKNIDDLPSLPSDPEESLSIECSYPVHIIRTLAKDYGLERVKAILSYNERCTTVRTQYPYSDDEFLIFLQTRALEFERGRIAKDAFNFKNFGNPLRNSLFLEGKITIESEGSMLACKALSPKEDSKVLDACAAPGGKTAYLSKLMNNKGKIVATDVSENRVSLIKSTLKRLLVENADVLLKDESIYDEIYDSFFDYALIDAPCSCIDGLTKPDARYRKTEDTLKKLPLLQFSILNNVARYIKHGGSLIYSTCTLLKDENERIIQRFLWENMDYELCDFSSVCKPEQEERAKTGMITLTPDKDETKGFFMAKLVRK
ncbi:MAG: 16S rRNA (cytosine(967)-C(5))-methyltransferase RsmB [Clostridia bacterium]